MAFLVKASLFLGMVSVFFIIKPAQLNIENDALIAQVLADQEHEDQRVLRQQNRNRGLLDALQLAKLLVEPVHVFAVPVGPLCEQQRNFVLGRIPGEIQGFDIRFIVYKLAVLNQNPIQAKRAIGKARQVQAKQRQLPGGSWSCGYHALKNILYVLNMLQNDNINAQNIIQLRHNVTDLHLFMQVFYDGQPSWLQYARDQLRDFDMNRGIFPDDQLIMLDGLQQGHIQFPPGIVNSQQLIQQIFPVFSDDLGAYSYEQRIRLAELFRRLKNGQLSAIAFTAPQNQQHFAGYIFHQTNMELEVFVVDSLNRNIQQDIRTLLFLLDWYAEF